MTESQIPLTEAQKGVANAGILYLVPVMINVTAAICLFRLRWTAVPLFGIAFAVTSALCWFWEYAPPVASVIGSILILAAFLYAIRLKRIGVLS